jgi:hypothetical protein
MLWRDMRGRTRRKSTNELQDLDPNGSPHLKEKLIGRNVDLDLLSLFPQDLARIMGGGGRESKASRSNNGGEREREGSHSPRRKKGAFYRSPTKTSRCWALTPESPALRARVSGPKSPAMSQEDSEPNTEACTTPEITTAGVSGP